MGLIALALAPSIFWLWWFWRQDRSTREGAGPMARAFLWGTLSVIPALILEIMFGTAGQGATMLECFLVIGPAEELAKFLATLRTIKNEPEFDEPSDGIVAAAAVALGFAFAENLGYFAGASGGLMLVRSVLSVPGHVLFAVFYGAAIGRYRCLPGASAWGLVRGLAMASAVHGLFDALLFHASLNPVLFLGMFLLLVIFQWRMYRRLAAQCAAEGRSLRRQNENVFVDAPILAPLDSPTPPPPAAPRERFRVLTALGAFGWGVFFFMGTAFAWTQFVPPSQQNSKDAVLGALCIVAMILGGLVSAYRSPGRTVRESAVGLGLLGALFGIANPLAGATFATVLGFLGAFGGWLGEALQDVREGRR